MKHFFSREEQTKEIIKTLSQSEEFNCKDLLYVEGYKQVYYALIERVL